MIYIVEDAIRNGLYLRIEKDIMKHEKVILRALEMHKNDDWLRKWLVRKIIGRSRVSNRYECIVHYILQEKYGVP